jgi:hypothetical protein
MSTAFEKFEIGAESRVLKISTYMVNAAAMNTFARILLKAYLSGLPARKIGRCGSSSLGNSGMT